MRKFLSLVTVLVLCSILALAQTVVTGRVTDPQGQPVPFATIKIKGSKLGTSADADGVFSIRVSPSQTLVISGTGIAEKQVTVGNEKNLSIEVARSNQALTEVVVTALGIKRNRNELPYAAQTVSAADLTKTREDNLMNALSGKAAGLQVNVNNNMGGSTNVILRGFKSANVNGTNQALFVVDGVPIDNTNTNGKYQPQGVNKTGMDSYDYGSPAADLNPDDIESVNVLKGAAASALYGSRAANGVIQITTKKGRKGLGITVNAGGSTGTMDKSTWVKYQHSYGAGYYDADNYTYSDPATSPDPHFLYTQINGTGPKVLVVPTTEDASFGAAFNPNLNVYQWTSFVPTSPNFGKATPWVAASHDPTSFFQNPINSSASIFIDGGGDKGSFKFGYARNGNRGILPNSNLTKNLFNFAASYNLTDRLMVTASVNYTKTDGVGRYGNGYGDTKNIAGNFRQWWEMNVDVQDLKNAYFQNNRQNITWNMKSPASGNTNPIFWDNPYFSRYSSYENDTRDRYISYVTLNYKATDWLNLMGRVSLDNYTDFREQRNASGTVGVPGYQVYNGSFKEYNYDFLATVNKDLSRDLNLKALVGTNLRQDYLSNITDATNGGLVIPGFYAISNSLNTVNPSVENASMQEVGGIFGGVTLTYKEFLILDATERVDQASTLPSNHNRYSYPSVSGGFVFSKLMPEQTWLSLGKLRVNYASVGNAAPVQVLQDYYDNTTNAVDLTPNSSFGGIPLYSVNTTKNNPDLKPEITTSYEGGLEMSFLNNRLGFDLTYYHTNTKNQTLPVVISYASGFQKRYVNAGNVENKGIELSLNFVPIQTKDFTWTARVNWTKARNKVISLYPGADNILLGSFQGGVSTNAAVGQPFGVLEGSDFVRDSVTGQKSVGANGYYVKSATTNNVIGNINPDWFGGITNTFNYKNFALSFLIEAKHGGSLFSIDQWYGQGTGLYAASAGKNDLGNPVRNDVANGGGVIFAGTGPDHKPNTLRVPLTGLFGYGYNNFPNSAYIYDASYVKLREVSINYSIPRSALGKTTYIKGINISLYGRNLWIIHKNLPDADPEDVPSSGNIQGVQVGSYPTYRNMGLNVKFNF